MKTIVRIAVIVSLACLTSAAASAESASSLDAWPAAAHPGPILVRLDDGRTLEALGPLHGGETTLILRLTDDSLVSVDVESIKKITKAPGQPRKPASEGATREDAPAVITNADLPPPLPSQPVPISDWTPQGPQPTATDDGERVAAEPERAAEPASRRPGEHVDRDGHGEQWWRDRKKRLEEGLAATVAEIERLEDEVRVAKARAGARTRATHGRSNRTPYPRRLGQRVSSLDAQKLNELEDAVRKLEAAEARKEKLQAELDGLPDQARQANALPGWLR